MAKRNGPPKIKQYSLDFKFKAVQLNARPCVMIKGVAESLCIHCSQSYSTLFLKSHDPSQRKNRDPPATP
jgi:hypothetical protein